MRPGDVIADRFVAEALIGVGGMGSVYKAHDRHTDEPVALKVMRDKHEGSAVRFFLEARVLADLRHPGIVRYIGHGATASGEHWLAMEWLEGTSLADRLDSGPLSVTHTLALAGRVAEALSVAHSRGVVHRDIKPSNLFLVGGSCDRVKILDFGVARLGQPALPHTASGRRVGTPRYMAPEQVRGDRDLDARVDVFALGCVLYYALAGRPAFAGNDEMAVFAKIILEEPVPVSSLRPEVLPGLARLITRMLAKDVGLRPADGGAVDQALRELTADTVVAGSTDRPIATVSEQRLFSVIMLEGQPPLPTVRAVALRHGGHPELLADGKLVVTLSGGRSAVEQAVQSARLALALARVTEGRVALATGRALRSGRRLLGEAIDRAAELLYAHDRTRGVDVDGVTAALLAGSFDLAADGVRLLREGDRRDPDRTVLGKLTPFVGRERELRTLEAIFDECVVDRVARVVLVTSPPGMGKTRLRRELAQRLAARPGELAYFLGRGDSMRAGSPFSVIAPALRSATGVHDGDPLDLAEQKILALTTELLPSADADRVAVFLGELVGVPFVEGGRVQLRAARGDPMLMGDQMRRAWEDFLGAECARRPVLLVLEDIHYGDLPSMKFIDAALRNVAGPLMILALARAEVHSMFPGLWAERALTEIRLGELPRRAGAELVRAVVGDLPDDDVHALLDRSGGNVLYLEELLRAHAEGRSERLPPTVLAMVQLRVEGFPAEARRLLRAGSVFGEVFWLGGLAALYGKDADERELGEWLRVLAEKEVLTRRLDARFPGDEEYVFRHALVREASYAMWTAAELVKAHGAAGAWLEQRGESDAMLLAAHFDRGGEPWRAVSWTWRAAEQALEGNDFAEAVVRADLAIARGAEGPVAAELHLIAAQAHVWSGVFPLGIARARAAMALAERCDSIWSHALGQLALLAGKLGDHAILATLVEEVADCPVGKPWGPLLDGLSRLATALLLLGDADAAATITPQLELSGEERAICDPTILARIDAARSIAFASAGDVGGYLRLCESAVGAYEQAGDLRGSLGPRVNVGFALIELGAYSAAVTTLRETLASARRLGVAAVAGALLNLGWALARAGILDEALVVEREAAELFRAQGARYYQGSAEIYVGRIRLAAGDVLGAAHSLETAAELLQVSAPLEAYARAALAEVYLTTGRLEDGLAQAGAAAAALEALGEIHEGESYVRLVLGKALRAAGRDDEAALAMARARTRLLERAAKISDPVLRQQFLTVVPENRETMLGGASSQGSVTSLGVNGVSVGRTR